MVNMETIKILPSLKAIGGPGWQLAAELDIPSYY